MSVIVPLEMPWANKYPCHVEAIVQWPIHIQHTDGRTYYKSGKEGTRSHDGCPSAEYSRALGAYRLWLALDGTITED